MFFGFLDRKKEKKYALSMEILILLEGIGFILSFWVIILSFRKIKDPSIRTLFVIMLGLFILSTALSFSQGRLNDWIRHIPFFGGQLVLFLLVKELIYEYADKKNNSLKQVVPSLFLGGSSYFGIDDFISYLTDQGIQDILTLPLTILVGMYVWVRYPYIQNAALKKALLFFVGGASLLTLIYVLEFFIDAQNLVPFLADFPLKLSGFVLYYLALFCFGMGVGKLSYQK